MTAQSWLRHVRALATEARRYFLHGLFRLPLFPRAPFRPTPPAAGDAAPEAGTDVTLREGDCTVRLMSTEVESSSAVEALSQLGVERSNPFPLAVYWSHAQTGFRDAHEWVHYGVSSRRASLNALLARPEAGAGAVEEITFVLHCSRDAPPLPVTGRLRREADARPAR